jgi:hypothetical protein
MQPHNWRIWSVNKAGVVTLIEWSTINVTNLMNESYWMTGNPEAIRCTCKVGFAASSRSKLFKPRFQGASERHLYDKPTIQTSEFRTFVGE